MRFYITTFIFFFFININYATNIDSLIRNIPIDSNGVDALIRNIEPLFINDKPSAKKIINQALKISKQINYTSGKINAEIANGLYYYYIKQYDTALTILNRAEKLALDNNDNNALFFIYNNKGVVYGYLGFLNLKAQELIKSVSLAEESNKTENLFSPYFNLGVTFYTLSDIPQAKIYFLKAKKYANSKTKRLGVYNNLASIEEIQNNYKQALILIDSAIANYLPKDSKANLIICQIMRTKYLFKTGHKQEALKELQKLDTNKLVRKISLNNLNSLKASIAFSKKNYNTAIIYADSAMGNKVNTVRNSPYLMKNMFKIKIESYIALKEYSEAIAEQKKLEIFKDAISVKRSEIHPKEIEYQVRMKKKEIDILKLQSDNELLILKDSNKNLYIYLNIVISILLVLIVIVLLFMRKSIKIKNQIASVKKEQVEEKLKSINNSIVSKSLIISEITDNLQKLINDITNIQSESSAKDIFVLNKLLEKTTITKKRLQNTINSDNELSIANEDFYRKLLEINSSFTPSELKMCTLLKLNLNTKEISQMNYQSIRTTEGIRYRIRKKLELSSDDNLNIYLMNV